MTKRGQFWQGTIASLGLPWLLTGDHPAGMPQAQATLPNRKAGASVGRVLSKGKDVIRWQGPAGADSVNQGRTAERPGLFQDRRMPVCKSTDFKKRHWGEGVTAEEIQDYTWVQPEVVAEIKFAEWTHGEVLRHPEFVMLRADKDPNDVAREG